MRIYRIRTLLVIGAVALSIVPAAIVAVAAGFYIQDRLVDNALQRSQVHAQQLASTYELFLDKHLTALTAAAAEIAAMEPFDAAAAQTRLARVRAAYPAFSSSVALFDAAGDSLAIATSALEFRVRNVSDRAWFTTVTRTRRPLVEPQIIRSRVTGRMVVVLAAPMLGADGALRGAISAGLDLEQLDRVAATTQLGRSGYSAMAAADGTIILHPRRDLPGESASVRDKEFWQDIARSDTGVLADYDENNGQQMLGGFATVPSSRWKVWVGQAHEEIVGTLRAAYLRAALFAAAGAGAGLLFALVGAGLLARPIERLREVASAAAEGDLGRRADERGPRETVDLARALNGMSAALAERLEREREAQAGLRAVVAQFAVMAQRVAAGDLTARAATSDHPELGPLAIALNDMAQALSRLVGEIGAATADLTSASSEILVATSEQVSSTAEEAVAVKQTASSVAEVKQTGAMTMQKARLVAQAALRASEAAEHGRGAVEASIQGSREAKQGMETLAQRILGFIEQAEAIAEINAAVGDLAEQSNLLAVNASIEAAKAGDAGRGFAVVAAEIKLLADQSKQATAQVRRILADIQKASQAAMLAAEQVVKVADAGVGFATKAGDVIQELSQSITEAAQAGQQIVAASQEQGAGMDQIAAAMHNIEQSTNQTVAATRQVERAARDLNDLAQRLSTLVTFAGDQRIRPAG
ncbi:MAG: methyl-accepting chemotaxis protein [Alphaproteobacteria bacterium]